MNKRVALFVFFLITLTISSLLTTEIVYASVPKPSIPEFTVNLIDSSYDIPPTSSVNPYTGQTGIQAGHRIESRAIVILIKNQPFTPFIVEGAYGNSTVNLQYNIRWKGHYEQDWHEKYLATDGYAPANLESVFTTISFKGEYSSSEGLKLEYSGLMGTFPEDSKVDFQVEAMIGYVSRDPLTIGWVFNGETSGWSNTKTLTINDNLLSPVTPYPADSSSPLQTTTSQQPNSESDVLFGFSWEQTVVAVLCIALVVFALALVLLHRKKAASKLKLED